MTMELAVQTMTSFAKTLELARWAEAEGLAGMAVADHYLTRPEGDPYALDQLTVLAGIAAQTRSLELSTLVSPITFRHPAVMLKVAQTIDEISGGRFTLGVGAGWMQQEHDRFGLTLFGMDERFDRLAEALGYLRSALSGNNEGFTGSYYQLAPGPAPEPTSPGLRIVVGGGGPRRTPDLAGTYADEFNAFPSKVPFRLRIERARAAAVAAGRDPEELFISTAFPLVVGADSSEADDRIAEVARLRDADPADIKNRWSELGIPVGTADEVRSHLDELATVGVRRVYFQMAFEPLDRIAHSIGLLRD